MIFILGIPDWIKELFRSGSKQIPNVACEMNFMLRRTDLMS